MKRRAWTLRYSELGLHQPGFNIVLLSGSLASFSDKKTFKQLYMIFIWSHCPGTGFAVVYQKIYLLNPPGPVPVFLHAYKRQNVGHLNQADLNEGHVVHYWHIFTIPDYLCAVLLSRQRTDKLCIITHLSVVWRVDSCYPYCKVMQFKSTQIFEWEVDFWPWIWPIWAQYALGVPCGEHCSTAR